MEKQENLFKGWMKEHKKQILIGAGIAGTLVLVCVGISNQKTIIESIAKISESRCNYRIPDSEKLSIKKTDASILQMDITEIIDNKITRCPHSVNGYLRHLPDGYNASAQKIQEALDNGFELPDGYTYVNSYYTGKDAA